MTQNGRQTEGTGNPLDSASHLYQLLVVVVTDERLNVQNTQALL